MRIQDLFYSFAHTSYVKPICLTSLALLEGYATSGLPDGSAARDLEAAVHDAEGIITPKVDGALQHAADANMLDVLYVNSRKGVLLGYSPSTKERVIVTFSATNGVQTWHYQQPDCSLCEWVDRCRDRLIQEAAERDVSLPEDMTGLPPSKLAHHIFSQIIPELST